MSDAIADHPQWTSLLAYQRGELPAGDAEAVESHLAGCDDCSRRLLDAPADSFLHLLRGAHAGQATQVFLAEGRPGPPTEPPPAEIPAELDGHPRYRIEGLIGRGGMGDVYRAEHLLMKRPVAVKRINHELTSRPQAVERFRREVQAAAALAHPNIVTAHDAEEAGGRLLLVMEYVEGTNLAEVVQRRGPLPIAEACSHACQAARGLQHAFEQGMVHRDVKPHNLMLTPQGQVKILDFGLARFASETPADPGADSGAPTQSLRADLTAESTALGTPDYVAPEQARNAHATDIRADIYSLGCTLYFLLTGEPPFPEGGIADKLRSHRERPPRPLSAFREVPPGLEDVLRRMMAKDPNERFQTPAELLDALTPFTAPSSTSILTGMASLPRRVRTLVRKPRTRRIVLGACALLAVAALVYYLTDTGTVTVEADSPGLTVIIEHVDGGRAATVKTDTTDRLTLRAGHYRVRLGNGSDPYGVVEPADGHLAVERGGEAFISVRRLLPVPLTIEDADTAVRIRGPGEARSYTGALTRILHLPPGEYTLELRHAGRLLARRGVTVSVEEPPAITVRGVPPTFLIRPVREAVSVKSASGTGPRGEKE